MTLPRTVADVLTDHVVFELECIDRMYLNAYVPGLQYAPGLVAYIHHQLNLPIASTAPLSQISERFATAMHRFARDGLSVRMRPPGANGGGLAGGGGGDASVLPCLDRPPPLPSRSSEPPPSRR